jgi:hypothetical protein
MECVRPSRVELAAGILMNRILSCALIAVVAHAVPGAAQTTASPCQAAPALRALNGTQYEGLRQQSLMGNRPLDGDLFRRPSELIAGDCARANGIALTPVLVRSIYNSAFPNDRNNGEMWAGRGATAAFSAGLSAKWKGFQLTVAPVVTYSENHEVELAPLTVRGLSPYANAGHPGLIDWPQRPGPDERQTISPGQSSFRISWGRAAAGVSTENLWLGPAQQYPILMGTSAAGFPHAYVALRRIAAPIGHATFDLFWGRLDESEFFDQAPENDHRFLNGLAFTLEPRLVPGLAVGFARLYMMADDGKATSAILGRPFGISSDPLRALHDNSIYALHARYALPRARAEVYAEWAHEAPYRSVGDLLREPDQTQAYTLGFSKLLGGAVNYWHVYGEATHLEATPPLRAGRGVISYYTHATVTQGFTHQGQLLGSWLGPGSNAQRLGVDAVGPGWLLGVYLERNRFDADAYYDQWSVYYNFPGHDAQVMLGTQAVLQTRTIGLQFDAAYGRRYNRAFARLTGLQPMPESIDDNLSLDVTMRWTPLVKSK